MNLLYVLIVTRAISGSDVQEVMGRELTQSQCTLAASFISNYEDNVIKAECKLDGDDA
jgi:hypothetical protein